MEDEIKVKEIQMEMDPTVENREALNKVNVELNFFFIILGKNF